MNIEARHTILLILLLPGTAQAYGASGGAVVELFSMCVQVPLGLLILFTSKYLKIKAPLLLKILFVVFVLFSVIGVIGMISSFTTEVGYRPMAIGMHIVLIILIIIVTKQISIRDNDS